MQVCLAEVPACGSEVTRSEPYTAMEDVDDLLLLRVDFHRLRLPHVFLVSLVMSVVAL